MNAPSNLSSCKWYFFGFLILILSSTLMLITLGKAACFIFLNKYHSFLLNTFFINYTFAGDGIFTLCIVALLYFYYKRKQQSLALLMSFLLSGLIAQVIKNLVNSPRPKLFFEPGRYAYFIDGVTLANNSSFPSGHTATAFATATVLVLMMHNKNWQLVFLLAASLVGYSRIYLGQHFLLDVLIGAIIGCLSGILSVYITLNMKNARHSISKVQKNNSNNTLISSSAVPTV